MSNHHDPMTKEHWPGVSSKDLQDLVDHLRSFEGSHRAMTAALRAQIPRFVFERASDPNGGNLTAPPMTNQLEIIERAIVLVPRGKVGTVQLGAGPGGVTIPLPGGLTILGKLGILLQQPDLRTLTTAADTTLAGTTANAAPSEVTIANPGAGADFSFTPNAAGPATLISFTGTFTASATVANRTPTLQVTDAAGHVMGTVVLGAAVTAGQVAVISGVFPATWSNSLGTAAGVLPAVLPAGFIFKSVTGTIQAGDQWSSLFVVEQLPATAASYASPLYAASGMWLSGTVLPLPHSTVDMN